MALLIPETLERGTPAEREAHALLRRLPEGWHVWHASALEVGADEMLPFLTLGIDAGIVCVYPVESTDGADAVLASTIVAKGAFDAFKQLLIASEDPALVTAAGKLKPAQHLVALATAHTGRQVTSAGLRDLDREVVFLGKDEIDALPGILASATRPDQRVSWEAREAVRRVVSPGVVIPSMQPASTNGASGQAAPQPFLLDPVQEQAVKSFTEIPAEQQGLARDLDARLIRGVAGSGKSLVLLHRAHYLAQQNPAWSILVVTYTRALADFLNMRYAELPNRTGNVEIISFDRWCRRQLFQARLWVDPMKGSPIGFLRNLIRMLPPAQAGQDPDYLLDEFDWIREMPITSLDQYQKVERRGRKRRMDVNQRAGVWTLYESYCAKMRDEHAPDWTQMRLNLHTAIREGRISSQQYHAILVDEAQDFAPLWFKILQTQLKPSTNALFLVADAAQKLYRRTISWRSMDIDIKGKRSRILKRSYRNTFQILTAANELVSDSTVVDDLKGDDEELIPPDLNPLTMRAGPMPVIWQIHDPSTVAQHIAVEMGKLRAQFGYRWGDIAVFVKENVRDGDGLPEGLRSRNIPLQVAKGPDINIAADEVKLLTLHASKGLEFSVVFIVDVDRVRPQAGIDAQEYALQLAQQRRLLYVGMTRARDRLYLMHSLPLQDWLNGALKSVLRRQI